MTLEIANDKPNFEVNLKRNHENFFYVSFAVSSATMLLYYLIIEPFIIGDIIGHDIDMFWTALNGPVTNIYNDFGFIYPQFWWYEFLLLVYSYVSLLVFIMLTKLIGFPLGLYLINRKFSLNLRQMYILMGVLYPAFIADLIVRNLNLFLFLIGILMVVIYDKRPFLSGLLFWVIGFKITTAIFLFPILFGSLNNRISNKIQGKSPLINLLNDTRIKFLLGFIISIILIYIFFPLTGFSLEDYWIKLTQDERYGETEFNLILTISRIVHFDHMTWIGIVGFLVAYLFQTRSTPNLFFDIKQELLISKKKEFNLSIIFCLIIQAVFALMGGISYLMWYDSLH